MKKAIISFFILLLMLPMAFASHIREDKGETIKGFNIYTSVASWEPENAVMVFTVNSGERGYIVISAKYESYVPELMQKAHELIKTSPNQYETFAVARYVVE